MIVSLFVRK